jgi:hypothetical protein
MASGNTFENKITILAELWMNYRDDEGLTRFCRVYNDLGLPTCLFLDE